MLDCQFLCWMNVSDLVVLIFYCIYLKLVSGIVTKHAASGFNRVEDQIVNADIADYDPVTGFFVSTTMTMIPKTSTSSESLLSLYHLSNRDLCISAHISRPRQADQRPSSTSYCRDVDRDMNDMRAESTADYRRSSQGCG